MKYRLWRGFIVFYVWDHQTMKIWWQRNRIFPKPTFLNEERIARLRLHLFAVVLVVHASLNRGGIICESKRSDQRMDRCTVTCIDAPFIVDDKKCHDEVEVGAEINCRVKHFMDAWVYWSPIVQSSNRGGSQLRGRDWKDSTAVLIDDSKHFRQQFSHRQKFNFQIQPEIQAFKIQTNTLFLLTKWQN